jgi:hypothetical protein
VVRKVVDIYIIYIELQRLKLSVRVSGGRELQLNSTGDNERQLQELRSRAEEESKELARLREASEIQQKKLRRLSSSDRSLQDSRKRGSHSYLQLVEEYDEVLDPSPTSNSAAGDDWRGNQQSKDDLWLEEGRKLRKSWGEEVVEKNTGKTKGKEKEKEKVKKKKKAGTVIDRRSASDVKQSVLAEKMRTKHKDKGKEKEKEKEKEKKKGSKKGAKKEKSKRLRKSDTDKQLEEEIVSTAKRPDDPHRRSSAPVAGSANSPVPAQAAMPSLSSSSSSPAAARKEEADGEQLTDEARLLKALNGWKRGRGFTSSDGIELVYCSPRVMLEEKEKEMAREKEEKAKKEKECLKPTEETKLRGRGQTSPAVPMAMMMSGAYTTPRAADTSSTPASSSDGKDVEGLRRQFPHLHVAFNKLVQDQPNTNTV